MGTYGTMNGPEWSGDITCMLKTAKNRGLFNLKDVYIHYRITNILFTYEFT